MTLTATDLKPDIGSEVRIDADALLDGGLADELLALLDRRVVLVFPEQGLDRDAQVRLTRTLGDLVPMGDAEIFTVTLDTSKHDMARYLETTFHWHIDATMTEVPPRASLLIADRLPGDGGATEFASTYAAWEALPAVRKRELEGLRVVHSLEAGQRLVVPSPTAAQVADWRRSAGRAQPLVWTHRSGRKSLVLGATADHIVGLPEDEGRALLAELLEWATQPRFVYRHDWRIGDLVVWDNTGTMHRALPYAADSGREMRRTSLRGVESFA